MRPHVAAPRWTPVDAHRPALAKIVATLGPATDREEVLVRLIEAGVSVFRLNFSHGSLEDQAVRLRLVRSVTERAGRPVAVLGDLQGPKIRVAQVPDVYEGGGMLVGTGEDVVLVRGAREGEVRNGVAHFGTTCDEIVEDVEVGQRVLINDGAIRMLAVEAKRGEWLRCRVTVGGRVTTGKGINLPESDLSVPAITDKDWRCVEWAVERQLDFLALSFVRTANEVRALKERVESLARRAGYDEQLDPALPVIAKIEKPQALANIDDIVDVADGVMVARGDLGVEMDVAQVPVAQKYLVAKASEYGKPCIVATQMLESMIESATPTRAEASDVANAVFDGADAVMLSGETAVGKQPQLVVETMRRIIQVAEARFSQIESGPQPPSRLRELPNRSAALATGAWYVAAESGAKVMAVWSQIGGMATYLSQHDFQIPILAYTCSEHAARRMALLGRVTPVFGQPPASGTLADWTARVEHDVIERGMAQRGDAVVLIAGKPLGSVAAQNVMGLLRIGDESSGFRGA